MARSRSKAFAKARQPRSDPETTPLQPAILNFQDEQERLARLAEYRARFLAQLSHELRTPLTSVLGFAEILLSQETLTETQRGFCERIQNSAHQMRSILNQLSDLARLESRRTDILAEEFCLNELLRDTAAAVSRQAEKLGVKVELKTPVTIAIISDRSKLRQSLYNLFLFSIARSPAEKTVTVSITPAEKKLSVVIEDEGAPLTVAEPSTAGNLPDRYSEIGLVIAKENLDLLRGSLLFEHRPVQGLRISMILPLSFLT